MKKSIKYIFINILLVIGLSINCYSQEIDTATTANLFELSLEDLMNIDIVSATRQNQNITDAPSIVTVITSKQIKERGYLNVAEALNSVAGFDVITDHYQPNLGIRGINGGLRSWSRLIKIMIDGQNMSFRSSSDNFLESSLIPIEAISRIEIIRGPNSALYGKNAFLGVVNIITKSGLDLENKSASYFLGDIKNNPSYGLSTVWGGKRNKFDLLIASTYSKIDRSGLSPQNVPGRSIYSDNNLSKNNESNPLGIFFKLRYKDEDFGELVFDMNYQTIHSQAEFVDWGALTNSNTINLLNSYERLSYSNLLFDNFSSNFYITHAGGKPLKEVFDIDSDHSEWIERELGYTSYDLGFNTSYAFDDINNFSFGIDYTSDIHDHQKYYTVNNTGLRILNPGGTNGIKEFNNLGIYMQMIFNASEFFSLNYLKKLTLTAGYRFDYHNIYGDVLNYRLAAVYHIADHISTKVMYGTSFNAPSSVQLYSNYILPGGIVGNPDLKPERAKTLEWALMGRIIENVNFNTNVFYTEVDNKIEYLLPYGEISNIRAENISSIYSAGTEIELNANIYNNTAYLNYSYQKSVIDKIDPILDEIRVNTALYPSNIIKFGDIVHLSKYYLNINLEGKYISQRIASDQNNFVYDPINYATNRYKLDAYFMFDLSLSSTDLGIFDNTKTRISLKIQNLLDVKYNYPGFDNYDIPGLGRTYYFRLTQYF